MNAFFLAIQFLTRIPIPIHTNFNDREAGKCLLFFPLVSFAIGALVGSVQTIASPLDALVSGFFSLVVLYLLNGGIHLDGLADTADGFLSGAPKAKIPAIMHDVHVGAFGVMAVVIVLIGKWAALSATSFQPLSLGLILATARMGVMTAIQFYPSAPDSSMGKSFKAWARRRDFWIQWIVLTFLGLYLEGSRVFIFFTAALFIAFLFSVWSVRKIDGLSGDVYGALMEIEELVLLLMGGL